MRELWCDFRGKPYQSTARRWLDSLDRLGPRYRWNHSVSNPSQLLAFASRRSNARQLSNHDSTGPRLTRDNLLMASTGPLSHHPPLEWLAGNQLLYLARSSVRLNGSVRDGLRALYGSSLHFASRC